MKVISNLATYISINDKMILPEKSIDLTAEEMDHPRIKKLLEKGHLVIGNANEDNEDDGGNEEKPLEEWDMKKLKDLAKEKGIELTSKDNSKAKVIAKIQAAADEGANTDGEDGGDDGGNEES